MEGSIVSTLEAIVGQVLRLGTSDLQDRHQEGLLEMNIGG